MTQYPSHICLEENQISCRNRSFRPAAYHPPYEADFCDHHHNHLHRHACVSYHPRLQAFLIVFNHNSIESFLFRWLAAERLDREMPPDRIRACTSYLAVCFRRCFFEWISILNQDGANREESDDPRTKCKREAWHSAEKCNKGKA